MYRFNIDPSEIKITDAKAIRARLMGKPWFEPSKGASPEIEPIKVGESSDECFAGESPASEPDKIPEFNKVFIRVVDVVSLYKCVFSSLNISGRRKISDIIGSVAKERDVSVADLFGDSRVSYITKARQEAFYTIARDRPDVAYSEIGRRMGGKDHTTVTHGIRAHAARNGLPSVVRS